MYTSTSNIEPLARAICERVWGGVCSSKEELTAAVDRYWHCVASDIEAGLLDDAGLRIKRDVDGVTAYQDWRERHPDYVPPAWRSA
jgi:hypothetical protein